MKVIHKPLEHEAWRNLASDEEAYEPMPEWVKSAVEAEAKEGTTFMVKTAHGPAVCYVMDYVIKGPTDIYPCSPEGFAASYEEPQA